MTKRPLAFTYTGTKAKGSRQLTLGSYIGLAYRLNNITESFYSLIPLLRRVEEERITSCVCLIGSKQDCGQWMEVSSLRGLRDP